MELQEGAFMWDIFAERKGGRLFFSIMGTAGPDDWRLVIKPLLEREFSAELVHQVNGPYGDLYFMQIRGAELAFAVEGSSADGVYYYDNVVLSVDEPDEPTAKTFARDLERALNRRSK